MGIRRDGVPNAAQTAAYYFATTLPASGAVANPFDPGSNYLEAVPLFGSLETLFGAVDENGVEVYSSYIWPGQLAGPGDGSDGQPANQFSWKAPPKSWQPGR